MENTGYERNIPILSLSQALAMCGPPMIVFLGGIIGAELAPNESLATLPVAMLVVGVALATIPAANMMRRIGRRRGFQFSTLLAAIGALLASLAVNLGSFLLFCLAILLIGFTGGFIQQFRFAAAESVIPERSGRAVSWVLAGGIFAGFLGPEIATRAQDLLPFGLYSGSFIALALLYLAVTVLLNFLRDIKPVARELQGEERPLGILVRQPLFLLAVVCAAVAYGVMSFIMTATPLHLTHGSGYSLLDAKFVIQSHIMAMYIPSLFSGLLIERFGLQRVMMAGLLGLLACAGLAIYSRELVHYWGALVLLGVGWNFLFVGGTVLLTRTYLPAERFKAQAVNDFTVFSVQALASLSAGTVLFVTNWDTLNLLNLPILLITGGMLLVVMHTERVKERKRMEIPV
jgi:MFS family permease